MLTAAAVLLVGAGTAVGDVFSNIGPAPRVTGGLFGAYPLGSYALDSHFLAVSVGVFSGVDVSGVPPMIASFLANTLWQLTAFLANSLITVFTWAFSLNLLTGSTQTGGAGALAPVSAAVQSIYGSVFGAPWLVVAIVFTGLWAMWKALVQRRYTETAGSLAVSVIYVLVALLIVTQPQRTIGTASGWTNEMSAAFLSLTDRGTLDSEQQAKQADADQLFRVLIYEPWVVLEFGGIEHCTQTATTNSAPVQPLPIAASQQLLGGTEVQVGGRTCINNANKYASHFLRYPPASSDRNSEYEALKDGDSSKLPSSDPTRFSYQLGPADRPAVAAMGKGGQYERLLLSLVVLAGELGAFLLLGALSAGVILAQIIVLVLLAFAPVALVIAVMPGRGHAFFVGWLQRLVAFLVRKAVYSLILGVLLAVSSALVDATASLGWLLSFGLEAAFFWTVFLYRHRLTGQLSTVVTGHDPRHEPAADLAALYYARRLLHGGRGNGGPPPPPSPPAAGRASGSAGRDDGPPPEGPAAPPVDPEPPGTPPLPDHDRDLEPAGEQPDRVAPDSVAQGQVAQVDRGAHPTDLPARPRPALPAPPPVDQPERADGGTAPRQPAARDRPPADQPATPSSTGQLTAAADGQAPSQSRDDTTTQTDLPAPPHADDRPAASSLSGGDDRPSAAIADQEPSLAEQLRADAERLNDSQPATSTTAEAAVDDISEERS